MAIFRTLAKQGKQITWELNGTEVVVRAAGKPEGRQKFAVPRLAAEEFVELDRGAKGSARSFGVPQITARRGPHPQAPQHRRLPRRLPRGERGERRPSLPPSRTGVRGPPCSAVTLNAYVRSPWSRQCRRPDALLSQQRKKASSQMKLKREGGPKKRLRG